MRKIFVLFIALTISSPVYSSVLIEGVSFEQRRQVLDAELQLNGTALLTWAVFLDVYVAAFYLPDGQPGSRWTDDHHAERMGCKLANLKTHFTSPIGDSDDFVGGR